MKKSLHVYKFSRVLRLTGIFNLLLTAVIVYNVMAIAGLAEVWAGQKAPRLRSPSIVPGVSRPAIGPTAPAEVAYLPGLVEAAGADEGWRTVRMRVTAYCPCEKCCGEFADGITASGHKILPGDCFVAADRNFPFGTELIVPDYNRDKPVKVLDRGGAITGERLDVFFATHEKALQWGVKNLDVMVKGKEPPA